MAAQSVTFLLFLLIVTVCYCNEFEKDNGIPKQKLTKEQFKRPPARQLKILIKTFNSTLNVLNLLDLMKIYYPYQDFFETKVEPTHERITLLADRAQQFKENCQQNGCSKSKIESVLDEIEDGVLEMDKSNTNFLKMFHEAQIVREQSRQELDRLVRKAMTLKLQANDHLYDVHNYGLRLEPDGYTIDHPVDETVTVDLKVLQSLVKLYEEKSDFEDMLFPLYEKGFEALSPDDIHNIYNPSQMGIQLADIRIKSLVEENDVMLRQFVPHLNQNYKIMLEKTETIADIYDEKLVQKVEEAMQFFETEENRMKKARAELERLSEEPEGLKDEL